jgi:hypothetical protein
MPRTWSDKSFPDNRKLHILWPIVPSWSDLPLVLEFQCWRIIRGNSYRKKPPELIGEFMSVQTAEQRPKAETSKQNSILLLLPTLLGLAILLVSFVQLWLTMSLASGYGCGGVPFGFSGCIDFNGQPPWQAWEKVWEAYCTLGVGTLIGGLVIKRFDYSRKELRIVGISSLFILFLGFLLSAYFL